jgi:DNA-binding response OmpR family regulator
MLNKSTTLLQARDIVMDINKAEVKKWATVVKLSHLEFDLLKFLLQNKWKTLSRKEIFERVWGESDSDFLFSKTINVYIGYLRKKLGTDLIETKKGFWFLIP